MDAEEGDVHAEVEDGLLAAGLLALDELLDDVLHERGRGVAVGVSRRHRHRQVAELERRDLVLEVDDEVVVELDEVIARLERGERHHLLELHRELMPQATLVQVAHRLVVGRHVGRGVRLRVEEGLDRGHRAVCERENAPWGARGRMLRKRGREPVSFGASRG